MAPAPLPDPLPGPVLGPRFPLWLLGSVLRPVLPSSSSGCCSLTRYVFCDVAIVVILCNCFSVVSTVFFPSLSFLFISLSVFVHSRLSNVHFYFSSSYIYSLAFFISLLSTLSFSVSRPLRHYSPFILSPSCLWSLHATRK